MTDLTTILAAAAAAFALGAAAMYWIKSRKTTTRAEAIRLAAFAYKEALKLPSAADAITLAQEQAQSEGVEAAKFVALVAKSNVPTPL